MPRRVEDTEMQFHITDRFVQKHFVGLNMFGSSRAASASTSSPRPRLAHPPRCAHTDEGPNAMRLSHNVISDNALKMSFMTVAFRWSAVALKVL